MVLGGRVRVEEANLDDGDVQGIVLGVESAHEARPDAVI